MAPDRARIEKLLGMLGSSFDGERANAARAIASMAEKSKLSIVELVYGSQPTRPRATPKPKRTGSATILAALRTIAAECERWEFTLTEWEGQFAIDVTGKYEADYELSAEQLAAALRIIKKVEDARERGGPT